MRYHRWTVTALRITASALFALLTLSSADNLAAQGKRGRGGGGDKAIPLIIAFRDADSDRFRSDTRGVLTDGVDGVTARMDKGASVKLKKRTRSFILDFTERLESGDSWCDSNPCPPFDTEFVGGSFLVIRDTGNCDRTNDSLSLQDIHMGDAPVPVRIPISFKDPDPPTNIDDWQLASFPLPVPLDGRDCREGYHWITCEMELNGGCIAWVIDTQTTGPLDDQRSDADLQVNEGSIKIHPHPSAGIFKVPYKLALCNKNKVDVLLCEALVEP